MSVEATDSNAAEDGDAGRWTLHRTKTTGALTVNVAASGAAIPGQDYAAVPDTVTFAAGQDTVDVDLVPVADTRVEAAEVATLSVESGDGYTVGDPESADITIRADAAPRCGGRPATIVGLPGRTILGASGNDVIVGTPGPDTIKSKGGNDLVCALGGHDKVMAGGGKDKVWGQGGNDLLKGQGGKDVLVGGPGRDSLVGGPGRDTCRGGGGRNVLRKC